MKAPDFEYLGVKKQGHRFLKFLFSSRKKYIHRISIPKGPNIMELDDIVKILPHVSGAKVFMIVYEFLTDRVDVYFTSPNFIESFEVMSLLRMDLNVNFHQDPDESIIDEMVNRILRSKVKIDQLAREG